MGLIPPGVPLSAVSEVVVEVYRVFPLDSTNPPVWSSADASQLTLGCCL
jgi:hypothetical protein